MIRNKLCEIEKVALFIFSIVLFLGFKGESQKLEHNKDDFLLIVKDNKQNTVPYATIYDKLRIVGITNIDGQLIIDKSYQNKELRIRYIGYKDKIFKIGEKHTLVVYIEEDEHQLKELIYKSKNCYKYTYAYIAWTKEKGKFLRYGDGIVDYYLCDNKETARPQIRRYRNFLNPHYSNFETARFFLPNINREKEQGYAGNFERGGQKYLIKKGQGSEKTIVLQNHPEIEVGKIYSCSNSKNGGKLVIDYAIRSPQDTKEYDEKFLGIKTKYKSEVFILDYCNNSTNFNTLKHGQVQITYDTYTPYEEKGKRITEYTIHVELVFMQIVDINKKDMGKRIKKMKLSKSYYETPYWLDSPFSESIPDFIKASIETGTLKEQKNIFKNK